MPPDLASPGRTPANADAADNSRNANPIPSISLPKGGGAIQGIGEKFSVNPATGTSGATLPLPFSVGRDGFGPELSLSYDSGAGQGPVGLGWSLSIPSIGRRTDKGLPRYRDEENSDVFVLDGAEDLVPCTKPDGSMETFERYGHRVHRYRPRVEGLFARIERWVRLWDGDVHWRSRSGANVESIYGHSAVARVSDPDDASRVFQWLLEETRDDRGNVIRYEYKGENEDAIDSSLSAEIGRSVSYRYLKRVLYGNQTPFQAEDWHFEFVLDYGDHDASAPKSQASSFWPVRPDPFSSFRSGFEIRCRRLCRRALIFHRFGELGADPVLVRSLDFQYDENPILSKLTAAAPCGYRRVGSGYSKKSTPPVEFSYTSSEIDESVHSVDTASLEGMPAGLAGGRQWADLDGEGLAGVLFDEGGAWRYKRNEGGGKFGPAETVVDLAGHPTLASAHWLWTSGRLDPRTAPRFHTRSGALVARRRGEWIQLDFPATPAIEQQAPDGLAETLGAQVLWVGRSPFDLLVEVASEEALRSLEPNLSAISRYPFRGVIVTCKAADPYDFVSRFFAPQSGINEDPVTGSAHCCLGPYWSEKLGTTRLLAYQASARGGVLRLDVRATRVSLEGQAVTVATGRLLAD